LMSSSSEASPTPAPLCVLQNTNTTLMRSSDLEPWTADPRASAMTSGAGEDIQEET
jgi:hypothetical protein